MALSNLGQAQMHLGKVAAAADAYRQLIQLGRQAGHHLSTFGSISSLASLLNNLNYMTLRVVGLLSPVRKIWATS